MPYSQRGLGFLFVLLAFLWGGSFVAIKYAIEVFDPWFSAAFRLIVASLTLFLLFKIQRKSLYLAWSLRWKIWLVGLFTLGLPFSLLFWGEKYVSAGLAGMTNGTTPLWTAVLAAFLSADERRLLKNPWMIAGLGLGFVGILLIFLPLVSTEDMAQLKGAVAVLAMAVCYALGNILNKLFFTGNPDLKLSSSAFHQHLSSLVYLLLGSFLIGSWPREWNWSHQWLAWSSLLYLGVFSTAFALLVYFLLLKEWGAVKTSAVTYLVPIFAIALDFAFFGTQPGLISLAGMALVLFGVFLIRRSRPPNHIQSYQDKGNAQNLAHAK